MRHRPIKKDEIVTFNQIKVIASRMAVILNNEPQGWVISFRSKDDINTLSLQLSQYNNMPITCAPYSMSIAI